jgi:hypothetical protein
MAVHRTDIKADALKTGKVEVSHPGKLTIVSCGRVAADHKVLIADIDTLESK